MLPIDLYFFCVQICFPTVDEAIISDCCTDALYVQKLLLVVKDVHTHLSSTPEALASTENGQHLACFVSVHVCVVGGPFLSPQCSLPAGWDDDRSPAHCLQSARWQHLTELINTDAPQPGWPQPWQWLNWPQIAFDREQCQYTYHTHAHTHTEAHIHVSPDSHKSTRGSHIVLKSLPIFFS